MSVDSSDGLLEIHDPEIDPGAIMEQIRERIQQRRKEKGYEQRTFPSFGLTAYPEAPSDQPYDADLYYYLRLANESYGQIEVAPVLAPSPATQLPGVGRLWKMIRGEVHNLVLFYVNRSAMQQITINRYLVSTLNRLTALTQEQQRTIETLQADIETLRATQGES